MLAVDSYVADRHPVATAIALAEFVEARTTSLVSSRNGIWLDERTPQADRPSQDAHAPTFIAACSTGWCIATSSVEFCVHTGGQCR
jgi:hypothetical protein